MKRANALLAVTFAMVAMRDPAAVAQCPIDWLPGQGHPGVTGDLPVWSLTTWDPDRAGPQPAVLIAGGGFEAAGNVGTWGIASWNGAEWAALGGIGTLGIPGMNDQVMAVTVYNGDLIAAGFFTNVGGVPANRIARWDGTAWHALGDGLNTQSVRALAVYNGELYAGGFFDHAGGVPATGIARWNGASWHDVGGGIELVSKTGGIAAVFAMTVFDGKLIVGGGFTSAGGVPADNLASWNGSTWQSMDGGTNNFGVESLGVYNGILFAGAAFQFIGNIAQWNPATSTWQSLGGLSPSDRVFALSEYNGVLYVGGVFTSVGGISTPNHMARWNGSSWSSVPDGPGEPGRRVRSFAIFNGDLIAGGLSTEPSGNQTSQIGRWDGSAWHNMGGGLNGVVAAVASFQGDVYVGGQFMVDDIVGAAIARRSADGTWDSLDGGVSGAGVAVDSMVVYNNSLVISGSFTHAGGIPVNSIAQWNGTSWSAFGNVFARALFVHDGQLYGIIGSGFPSVVFRWNPLTQQWQQLGTLPPNVVIRRMAVFNGELVAAGIGFGGAPAAVYRWDGAIWHPMGGTFGFTPILALAEYNGELFAGGPNDSGGGPPGGIIRWDAASSSWQTLAGGLFEDGVENFTFEVSDLLVHDGDLIVVGAFSHAGEPFGTLTRSIARWNGSAWSGLGGGLNSQVVDICEHDGGLLMGGWFTMADGNPNGHFAQFGSTCAPADLNGDGVVNTLDLGILLSSWSLPAGAPGCGGSLPCAADINGDGVVNTLDLGILLSSWSL